jgi:hypothetical protein
LHRLGLPSRPALHQPLHNALTSQRFHPGGEFKGIRPTYGSVTNDQELLFGARRPHRPFNFTLAPDEVRQRQRGACGAAGPALEAPPGRARPAHAHPARAPHPPLQPQAIVRVDLQHDHVMRWMSFTTSKGYTYEWGFKDNANTTAATITPPREGAYLAAFRGYEGKQLPPELGGYKKRYIIQVGAGGRAGGGKGLGRAAAAAGAGEERRRPLVARGRAPCVTFLPYGCPPSPPL